MQAANPRRGYILGLSAYIIWGLFPIYFKAIANVPSVEIIIHRVLWSALFGAASSSARLVKRTTSASRPSAGVGAEREAADGVEVEVRRQGQQLAAVESQLTPRVEPQPVAQAAHAGAPERDHPFVLRYLRKARKEDLSDEFFNIVGFQTKMKIPEQRRQVLTWPRCIMGWLPRKNIMSPARSGNISLMRPSPEINASSRPVLRFRTTCRTPCRLPGFHGPAGGLR